MQWFFDNLLPEADTRLQLMTFIKNDVTVGTDTWTMLEHFGAESAGALTLLAPALQLGMGATSFNREFNKMVGGIEAAAAELQAEFEARTDVPKAIRASQIRMLGSIRFLPIATMAKQLQRPK